MFQFQRRGKIEKKSTTEDFAVINMTPRRFNFNTRVIYFVSIKKEYNNTKLHNQLKLLTYRLVTTTYGPTQGGTILPKIIGGRHGTFTSGMLLPHPR